jgi:hypothetical protein
MKWQTLDLEYAKNLVRFREMYLIFSDWQSFNKVEADAMLYLCSKPISIFLPNVLNLEAETASHLLQHKKYLEIGITELDNETVSKSLLNDRSCIRFSHLKKINPSFYKYFENNINEIVFEELVEIDDLLLTSLSKHVGILTFENIEKFNKHQLVILQSHVGEIKIGSIHKDTFQIQKNK